MCSSNLIKSDDKLRQEIRDFSKFQKKTPRRIYERENYSNWINIRGEIKE